MHRFRKRQLGLLVVVLLVVAGCRSAPQEPAGAPDEEAQAQGSAETAAPPASGEHDAADEPLAISFDGDDCHYHGPTTVVAGVRAFTVANAHAERTLAVVMARFEDGHTYDDFLEWLGEDRPSEVPQRAPTPEWLDGDWRPINEFAPGTDASLDVTVAAGEYAVACWLQGPPGNGHAWPATPLTVTQGDEDTQRR